MSLQLTMFPQAVSSWKAPNIADLPSWAGAKRIAIDTETRDPDLKKLGPGPRRPGSYIVGISFAIEDGPAHYLPIRHAGGGNLPEKQVLDYIRDQAKNYEGILVGANSPYDQDFLGTQEKIEFPKIKWSRDVLIADPLIYELHDHYNLDAVAKRHGFEGKNEDLMIKATSDFRLNTKNVKGDLWQLPAEFVGPYGEEDARLLLPILRKQELEIEAKDLWEAYDLESKLSRVLLKMRRRGVAIDCDRLTKIEEWAHKEEALALDRVHASTGVRIKVGDVWKPEVVAQSLLAADIRVPQTALGATSITKDFLAEIDHPVPQALARARKVNKLRTTFAKSVRTHMVNGRIHCTLNQMRRQKEGAGNDEESGAKFGRLSCTNPNLQQQPARDAFAPMWRSIYLPDPAPLWAADDYSQQEPRWAVEYACQCRKLIGHSAWEKAIVARERYIQDPHTDNHQMMADMIAGRKATPKERKDAKVIYLGLSYGMGAAKLCRELGYPTMFAVRDSDWNVYPSNSEEGQQLIRLGAEVFETAGPEGQKLLGGFDREVPFVKRLAKKCEKRAHEVGYIVLAMGRRCNFPKDEMGNWDRRFTCKAFNRLIQGTSSIQTKMSMVLLDEAGFDLIIQVHDENAIGVENKEQAEDAATIMRNALPAKIPFKVDVEIGKSWGHSMGFEKVEAVPA